MRTEEKIIKYLENEFSPEEKVNFEKELESSPELKIEFQKYLSVIDKIKYQKSLRLNSDYVNSFLPEFHIRVQSGKKETIRKSLSYAFGIMMVFITGIAVLRIFYNNQKSPIDIEEFMQSLSENQKIELLENLNGTSEGLKLPSDTELVDLLEADLNVNNEVMDAYDISYKEIIVSLNQSEIDNIYQEIYNRKFLEEAPL